MQIFLFRTHNIAAKTLYAITKLVNAGHKRSDDDKSASIDREQLKYAIQGLALFFAILLLLLLINWLGDSTI